MDSLPEELNNTFSGPNYEGVVNGEAMWWRDSDMNDIESTCIDHCYITVTGAIIGGVSRS